VASRLKAYVRKRAGYNTSDGVLPILSAAIRKICDEAIRNARRAERETVLDRDVPREDRYSLHAIFTPSGPLFDLSSSFSEKINDMVPALPGKVARGSGSWRGLLPS